MKILVTGGTGFIGSHACVALAAAGHAISYKIGPRRTGNSALSWADPALAKRLMGRTAARGPEQMCADAWRRKQGSSAP